MDGKDVRLLMEEQLKLTRKLKARIQELEDARNPPLAVVGLAMRLPGDLNTPDAYWRFLRGDSLALSEIPEDRVGLRAVYSSQRDQPGKSYVNRAGFLRDVASFDASFFGINQREAEALDPQQRLLLEISWEAMERAGIPVRRQDRLSAGVFVGIMASEYGERLAGKADKSEVDPYYGTGGGHCFAAGRISYALGFSGPALSVDTACSSSLVALHLGVQSLRRGECRYVLIAGSNLLLSADLMVSLSQSKALAPDGRSKTFTADADGYGRGEGVGVMVLMRLDEAKREGRPILAVVRGTAVNHDGASSGLTVPNGPAQQDVIRAALQDAGVGPEELGYVEAHGTGTALGDPIEVNALDAVAGSGAGSRAAPLAVGSVKARIGHLEAAAGVAGLLKLVLMLHHAEIPATLSEADGPLNRLIPWDRLNLQVPRRNARWPSAFERKLAGISAFGLSGTNAHAVLERYEAATATLAADAIRPELLMLSAKDKSSLAAFAQELRAYLTKLDPALLPAACHTLRAGRAPFRCRVAVIGAQPAELIEKLEQALNTQAVETPQAALLMANLRVSQDSAALESCLTALSTAFPRLDTELAASAGSAQVRLERLFALLGVRVKCVADAALGAELARLEWGGQARTVLERDPRRAPDLLLETLAALHLSGADLRLSALGGGSARYLGDLPTYAFRRKRYWIDEVLPDAVRAAGPDGGAEPAQLASPGDIDAFLLRELREVLRAEGELDPAQTFLAVGGDSFTAMLLKRSIEQEYGIEVPVEELSTEQPLRELLARLSDFIARATGQQLGMEQSA
jgi:acyl transferase domain-containing protein